MDHLARIAMKNAANCVKYGEMQGYRNRYMSNAYCGPVIHLTGPHLSEGLLNITSISGLARHMRQTTAEYWDSPWRYIGGELRPQYFGCFLCALALCVCACEFETSGALSRLPVRDVHVFRSPPTLWGCENDACALLSITLLTTCRPTVRRSIHFATPSHDGTLTSQGAGQFGQSSSSRVSPGTRGCRCAPHTIPFWTSDQVRLPAKFKHII